MPTLNFEAFRARARLVVTKPAATRNLKTTRKLWKAPPELPLDTTADAVSGEDRFLLTTRRALRGSTRSCLGYPRSGARRNGRAPVVSRTPIARSHRRTGTSNDFVVHYRKRKHGHSAARITTDPVPAHTAPRRLCACP